MGTLSFHKFLLAGALLACLALPAHAEPSAAAAYLTAEAASNAGDWPQAGKLYTELWRRDHDPALLRQAFLLSLGAGDMPAALELADHITPDMPEALIATSLQVAAAIKAGRPQQAAQNLDRVPRRGLGLPFASLIDAWLLGTKPGPDALPAALDQLAGLEELDTLQKLHTALIAEAAGAAPLAKTAYAVLAEEPTPRLAMLVAGYYRRTQQPKRAAALLKTMRLADPTDLASLSVASAPPPAGAKPDLKSGVGEVYYDMAELLLDGGHPDVALLYAQMGAYVTDNAPGLVFLRGSIENAQSRYEVAADDLHSVPASYGFGLLAQVEAIANLQLADETAPALAAAQALVKTHPGLAEPRIVLADLYRRDGDDAAALPAYGAALALLPPGDPRRATLLFARGVVADHLRREDDAEADLQQAVALSPHEPLLLNYLGYFWAERGRNLDQAHALLTEASTLSPEDGSIIDSLGWVLYRQHRYDEAAATLEKAVALRPGDSNINAHLGDAYWQLGRQREADFQWRHALLNAKAADSADLQARLREGLPAAGVPATAETHAELATPTTTRR
jgi:tetratricopeptide (TPR) repeat protein